MGRRKKKKTDMTEANRVEDKEGAGGREGEV